MKRDLQTILNNTTKHNNCLLWNGCLNTDGYPRAVIENNYNAKVHRIVWELSNNTSAKNLIIRHTCDTPQCINPDHLISGTTADNILDRDLRERNGNTLLTHDQVREIRLLRQKQQLDFNKHAKHFGVSKKTLQNVVYHQRYRYVK